MALGTAQSVFDRVSFDLIYALPGQSADAWAAELERALGFGTGHLSLYQLTIEPGTRFAALAAKGELRPGRSGRERRPLRVDAGDDRRRRACPPMKSPTMPGPARRAGTISLTGATRPMPASAPARTAGATAVPRSGTGSRKTGWAPSPATAMASSRRRRSRRPSSAIEALLMGLRLAEGISLVARAASTSAAVDRSRPRACWSARPTRLRATPRGMLLLDGILAEIVS